MLRSTYYTNAGNPLQTQLLPRQALALEFPLLGGLASEARSARNRVLLCVACFDILIGIASLLFGWIAFGLMVLFYIVYSTLATSQALGPDATLRLVHTLTVTLVTIFFAFLLQETLAAGVIAMGGLLSLLTYQLSTHWTHRCTISPLPRAQAQALRRRWQGHILIASGIPLTAACLSVLCSNFWMFPGFLGVFCIIQMLQAGHPRHALSAARQAVTSWCAYNAQNTVAPGLFQSPGGAANARCVRLVGYATAFSFICHLPEISVGATGSIMLLPLLILPGMTFVAFLPGLTLPVLAEALTVRGKIGSSNYWDQFVTEIKSSPNPHVRDAYYQGILDADGSPLIVPRSVFNEHAHFLGSSGAGKTSKGLNPWIEQTIGFGDCSLIIVDLKADTLELLATMQAAAENLRNRGGRHLPVKVFSSQGHLPTYGFNPFTYPHWRTFSLYQKTDIICGALGLIYGTDYGAGYYSAANAAVIYETLRLFPDSRSFREMADRCRYVMSRKGKTQLHSEIGKDAGHVYETLRRMADFEQLQICPNGQYAPELVENAIDLTDLFRRPQMLYVHLSASLAPGSAPSIARLFTYMLLTSATQTERTCQVYLVIDEFQRMVAQNLDYMLQLARSMGVGIILSNQSIADLKTDTGDLAPTIEANCRYRQWFDVPSADDRELLMSIAGETVERLTTHTEGATNNGFSTSESRSETILPRLSINEILDASSHPRKSVIRLARGEGYAQHAGLPIVVRSDFHIDKAEYERRRAMPWPALDTGMLIPRSDSQTPTVSDAIPGPTIIREEEGREIEQADQAPTEIQNLFDDLKPEEPRKRRKRKRGGE